MNRFIVVIAFFAALGAAYATKDWKAPPQHRVKAQGRRFLQNARAPSIGDLPEIAPDLGGADAVKDPTPKIDDPAPEPEKLALREISDVALCLADKAKDPTFKKSCEIHIGIDGELSWHVGDKSRDINSLKDLRQSLGVKAHIPDVVWVPDRDTVWMQVRLATLAAQKSLRGQLWLGCAKTDDPTLLRVLRFHQMEEAKPERPAGPSFIVGVKEVKSKAQISVNGQVIETFPSDLAIAWNEWKKQNPGADTSVPGTTPVVLDAHRFAPCSMVIEVIDVLRGIGIEHEFLEGDLGRRGR